MNKRQWRNFMDFANTAKEEEIRYRHYISDGHKMSYSHVHPYFELYFCHHRIKQRSVINGAEYIYDFPCVAISAPYTIHSMSSEEEGFYERTVISFGEQVLSHFDADISHKSFLCNAPGYLFRLTEEQSNTLRSAIDRIISDPSGASEIEKELVLMLFLNKLLELCPQDCIIAVGDSDTYIQEVLRYIIENIGEDLTASSIAARFAVSRSKLDRDFIRVSGYSTHAFVENYRFNKAKEMLVRPKKFPSIGDISALCGFQSSTYFYSFFKKLTGMTPLEYRKKKVNQK